MSTILERVLADPALAAYREARDLSGLVAGLNAQCVMMPMPITITAGAILQLRPHRDIILDLLRDAADGQDIQARAAALMSPDGADTVEDRLNPPEVSWFEVNDALFNPDGSFK